MIRTRHGVRMAVRLDSHIALEAILLNRYERVPQVRREEWLRRLLVQGFLSECSIVRSVQERPQRSAQKEFGDWLVQESNAQADTKPPLPPQRPSASGGAGKPFAALHAVIGGAAAR